MVRTPLQRGVGIDEFRRSWRVPRADVSLLPVQRRKLAASFGEHFWRGIDASYLGVGKGIGEDAGQVAGATTEIVDCGIFRFWDAGDEIEAGAKANVGIAKVSLRLPSGHSGQKEIISLQVGKPRMDKFRPGTPGCDRAAPFRGGLPPRFCASCDTGDSSRFVQTARNDSRFLCWSAPARSEE